MKLKTVCITVLALAALPFSGSVESATLEPLPTFQTVGGQLEKYRSTGRELAGLAYLQGVLERVQDPSLKDYTQQSLGELRALTGDYAGAIQAFDRGLSPNPPGQVQASRTEDALEGIVRQAQGRQIVILNEAHHVPMGRAFALQLARRLRAQGFEYLACETFYDNAASTLKRGYPTQATGYYTLEPLFGDFVRQSVKLGFKPVAYEAPTSAQGINAREAAQAQNLYQRIFKKSPKAKVFIYVGYSHADEKIDRSSGEPLEWMASRLKKLTGIDPLTVDQTVMLEHSAPRFENSGYVGATQKLKITRPSLLLDSQGKNLIYGPFGRIDLQVTHPRVKLMGGRPDWLRMNGYRKAVPLEPYLKTFTQPLMVRARVQGEDAKQSIPMDQIAVYPGKPLPALMLPKGNYLLTIENPSGKQLLNTTLEVK